MEETRSPWQGLLLNITSPGIVPIYCMLPGPPPVRVSRGLSSCREMLGVENEFSFFEEVLDRVRNVVCHVKQITR